MKLSKKYVASAAALAAAIGTLTLPAAGASAAAMMPSPVHGSVQVWVNPGNGNGGTVNLTGAIGDAGTAQPANSLGKILSGASGNNADYRLLQLTKGWILVNITQFNKVTNNPNAAPTEFNKSNCSFVFSGKGRYSLFTGPVRTWA